jgi:hypothetical protein
LYYRWTPGEFLRQIRLSKADYVIVTSLLKLDMDGGEGNPGAKYDQALQVSEVVHSVRSLATAGYEIAVLKIDHAAVARKLDAGG